MKRGQPNPKFDQDREETDNALEEDLSLRTIHILDLENRI